MSESEARVVERTLDLSKLVESPTVKMPDGKLYEVLSPEQVGVRVTGMFTSWIRRRLGLKKAQSLKSVDRSAIETAMDIVDEESANRIAAFTRRLCEEIAPTIPKEQLDAIGEFGHLQLVGFWGEMYWDKLEGMDAEGKVPSPTSGSSSPSSNGFTEATRADG